jgi:hypothetical protein
MHPVNAQLIMTTVDDSLFRQMAPPSLKFSPFWNAQWLRAVDAVSVSLSLKV